jgi:hypothetical protein
MSKAALAPDISPHLYMRLAPATLIFDGRKQRGTRRHTHPYPEHSGSFSNFPNVRGKGVSFYWGWPLLRYTALYLELSCPLL